MHLTLIHRQEFGKDRFTPVCSNAQALLKISNRKSFTSTHIAIFKEAGWEITIEKHKDFP